MPVKLIVALALGAVLVLGVAGHWSGLYGFERYSGLFAPVWNKSGETVYVLRRTTSGFVWGLGWEFFTLPAYSYVTGDRFELLGVSRQGGNAEVLAAWSGSPVTGRITRHYRGRIFNYLSARLDRSEEGLKVQLRMSIPRIPSSETWGIDALWNPGRSFQAQWAEGAPAGLARPEAVLTAGREVLSIPGREGFDAAILIVEADGGYAVLLENGRFDALYPDGVPPKLIAERSRRKQIEKVREFRRVKTELVARFMAEEGLNEGQAILRAYDEMEQTGHLPRQPRLVATPLKEQPQDHPEELPVFDIPGRYLEAGLFQDIAAAIRSPGTQVKTGLGTYLAYDGDDLGPRLKTFREAGGARFVVRTQGRIFLIEELRP